ncbi:MAG TPA: serine/threonine-protein kinase [Polyangiaceae bacterium]|nr:serine/threonine-protein kinase [Polyangiaceae bacterium]
MNSSEPQKPAVMGLAPAVSIPGMAEGTAIPGSSGMTYRPLLELGEGGMARIVLALAAGPGGFNKLVVLKVIRSAQDSTEIRRLLLAEARLSARLNHPNVVQVQEVVHTEEGPYLVMEYLDGRPLSAVRDCAAITPNIVMTAISEALLGLHHAHELTDFDGTPLHIVHRDVSPHNIFLTFDGVAKVLDFGIAKMRDETTSTETGSVKGKIAYMPPEQLLGEGVDRRADIFAAGGMLWEAATGARMWANASPANLMHRLATGDIPKPSSVANVDPELERIIVRATAADRADRYQTALEMQQDLDAYLNERGMRASPREIGAVLSSAFAEDRELRARAIKSALRHNSVAPAAREQLDLPTTSESLSEPRPKRRWLPVALACGLAAALGTALLVRPSARPAPEVESAISLSIHAMPPEAKVRIDQREYPQSDVRITVPRDEHVHLVEIFAQGFVSDTRSVRFDRSLALDVALHPAEPVAAPVAPLPPSRPSEPLQTAHPSVGDSKKTKRPPATATKRDPSASNPKPTPASDDCNPPYFFAHGIKTYKPQCL